MAKDIGRVFHKAKKNNMCGSGYPTYPKVLPPYPKLISPNSEVG